MSVSPRLGLTLTADSDNPTFKSWRIGLTGTGDTSNMMILDTAVGNLNDSVLWAETQPTGQEDGWVWNEILP